MYCKNCGVELVKDARYCQKCGCSTIMDFTVRENVVVAPFHANNNQMVSSYVKPKDPTKYIIVGIGITFLIVIILVLIGNGDYSKNPYNAYEYDSNINKYSEVNVSNFTFRIPKEYETTFRYEEEIEIVANDWMATIRIEEDNFEELKEDKEYIKDYMEYYGYKIKNIEVKKYNNVEFITAEVTYDTMDMILLFAELDIENIAMVMIANNDYTLDYSLINEIEPIISSAYNNGLNDIQEL